MVMDTTVFKHNLQGIPPFDEAYDFYYDETGNCRKFSLKENGFNSNDAITKNFILGGLAIKQNQEPLNFDTLYSNLGFVEGDQDELKFKNVYHNSKDFSNFIGSYRATAFLKWLNDNNIYIHYLTLNNLYYSLVDIVDSLQAEEIIKFNVQLKNALYNFVEQHITEITQILYKNKYPDILNVAEFIDDIVRFISCHSNSYFLKILIDNLKIAKGNNELVFIQNNDPYLLIESYSQFYIHRCGQLSKSSHFFDEEPTIEREIKDLQFKENNNIFKNFKFIDSISDRHIQVSDMIVGLLAKLFYFLDEHSKGEITDMRKSFNKTQADNFAIIYNLMLKSENKSPLFIMNINSERNRNERIKKLEILSS